MLSTFLSSWWMRTTPSDSKKDQVVSGFCYKILLAYYTLHVVEGGVDCHLHLKAGYAFQGFISVIYWSVRPSRTRMSFR